MNKENLEKSKEIKMSPEMLNLLGCNKENFIKLIKKMNYRVFDRNNEVYFKYFPLKKNNKKLKTKSKFEDSPFSKLVQLNLK